MRAARKYLVSALSPYWVPLYIAALAAVHLVVNLVWLGSDGWDVSRIPDGFVHAGSLLHLSSGIELQGLGAAGCLRDVHSFYPVVAHLPRALASLVLGASPAALRAANVLYLVLLLVGVYKLGRLCLDRNAGLLAATLVSLMPAVHGGSRVAGLDFPALCVVPLAVYFLLRSDGFSRLPHALAFGVIAGLAALVKGQTLLFLFWPAALVLVRGLWRSLRPDPDSDCQNTKWWRVLLGSTVAVAALAAVSAVWWAGRIPELTRVLAGHATGKEMLFYESDPSVWGGVSYFLQTFPLLVSGPMVMALVVAAVWFLRRGRHRWEILLWLLVPLLLHMVLKVRHFRYLFPLVPAAAVIIGVGVYSIKGRWRHGVAGTLVAAAMALWLGCAFSPGPRKNHGSLLACVPQQQLLAGVSPHDLLLTCVGCAYSGPPAPAAKHDLYPLAGRLAGWISRRHPDGAGVLLQFEAWRHPMTVPLVILLLDRLPEARPFMVGGVRTERLSPSTRPAGMSTYQVMLTPATVPGATRVFRAPAEPDAATLWQLK